jgi:hypothetical protein
MKRLHYLVLLACSIMLRIEPFEKCSSDLFYLFRFLDNHSWFNSDSECCSEKMGTFFFQVVPSYNTTFDAFDACGNKLFLGDYLFSCDLTLADIYCPSKLAQDGIVVGGCDATQNYLIKLVPTEIAFCATQQTIAYDLSFFYQCYWSDIGWQLGVNIPVKDCSRFLNYTLHGGALGRLVTTSSEFSPFLNNLSSFFSEFSSDNDFFLGQVLKTCKNLTYKSCQNEIGLGDVSVAAILSFDKKINHPYFSCLKQCDVGINIVVPSSDQVNDQTIIWELDLGNNGATKLIPFLYFVGEYNHWFNPSLFISGCISNGVQNFIRIPRTITGTSTDFSSLCLPENFNVAGINQDYSCIDSTVSRLADNAVLACIDRGNSAVVRLSNRSVFGCLSLILAYIYDHKASGNLTIVNTFKDGVDSDSFSCDKVQEICAATTHTIEWAAVLSICENAQLEIGAQHDVAGINSVRSQRYFAQVIAYY